MDENTKKEQEQLRGTVEFYANGSGRVVVDDVAGQTTTKNSRTFSIRWRTRNEVVDRHPKKGSKIAFTPKPRQRGEDWVIIEDPPARTAEQYGSAAHRPPLRGYKDQEEDRHRAAQACY